MKTYTISQQASKTDDKNNLSFCDLDLLKSRKALLEHFWKVRHWKWNYQSHKTLSNATRLSVSTVQNCLRELRGVVLDWRYNHRHSNWYTLLPAFYDLPLFAARIKKFLSLTLLLSIINGNTVQREFYRPLVYRNLYLYDITCNSRGNLRSEIVPGENYDLLKREGVSFPSDVPPNVFKKRTRKEKRMLPTLDSKTFAEQRTALNVVTKHIPLTTHGLLVFFAFHPTVISLLGPIAFTAKNKFKTQEEIMKWIIKSAKNISNERGMSFSFSIYHQLRRYFKIEEGDKDLIDMAALAGKVYSHSKICNNRVESEFRILTEEQIKQRDIDLANHVYKDTGTGTYYQELFRKILVGPTQSV